MLNGFVTSGIVTAFYNTLLKERWRKEVMGRRRRGHKQLQDELKDKRGYCKFKEEALDRTLWRTHFGRGYGPVVRLRNDNVRPFSDY